MKPRNAPSEDCFSAVTELAEYKIVLQEYASSTNNSLPIACLELASTFALCYRIL